MPDRHRGGRGRKTLTKHIPTSVSLPPALRAALDSWVTPDLSRSEIVAELIEQEVSRRLLIAAEAAKDTKRKRRPATLAPATQPVPPAEPNSQPLESNAVPSVNVDVEPRSAWGTRMTTPAELEAAADAIMSEAKTLDAFAKVDE